MSSFFEKIIALFLLIIISPLLFILFIAVKLSSRGSFLFKQYRAGKNKKPFLIYKIRTMIEGAEKLKPKYQYLNQADGPVFKIYNDPRYTPVGKIIARLGFDELPQLINILKGEMSFVGPRPFPVEEVIKIPKKYQKRFSVKPGILSSWVAEGAFHNNFDKWMKLDLKDAKNKSFWYDLKIVLNSIKFWVKLVIKYVSISKRTNHSKTRQPNSNL